MPYLSSRRLVRAAAILRPYVRGRMSMNSAAVAGDVASSRGLAKKCKTGS